MKKNIIIILMFLTLLNCKGQTKTETPNADKTKTEIVTEKTTKKEVYLTDLKFAEKQISKQLKGKVKSKNPNGKLFALQSFNYEKGYIVLVSDFKSTESYLYYYNRELIFTKSEEFDVKLLKNNWDKIKVE